MLRTIIPEKVISKQELWIPMGFPGGASGKEHDCNAGDMRCGFNHWVRKISWRRE